jgi:competence protein ComEA
VTPSEDAWQCAPPEWRRAGEPRLALCRSLSGVYRYRKGESHRFIRLHADGELYTASIGSPKSAAVVWRDVSRWFGRDLRLGEHQMIHRYTFDGTTLRYAYRSSWNQQDAVVTGTFDGDGVLLLEIHNQTTGARSAWPSEYLGDGDEIAPPRADLNRASAAELAAALPSVTPRRAEAIVAYREAHGPFQKPGALLKVKGIGVSTLSMFQHLLDVR